MEQFIKDAITNSAINYALINKIANSDGAMVHHDYFLRIVRGVKTVRPKVRKLLNKHAREVILPSPLISAEISNNWLDDAQRFTKFN